MITCNTIRATIKHALEYLVTQKDDWDLMLNEKDITEYDDLCDLTFIKAKNV